jgi:hypothetical protein
MDGEEVTRVLQRGTRGMGAGPALLSAGHGGNTGSHTMVIPRLLRAKGIGGEGLIDREGLVERVECQVQGDGI